MEESIHAARDVIQNVNSYEQLRNRDISDKADEENAVNDIMKQVSLYMKGETAKPSYYKSRKAYYKARSVISTEPVE